MWPVQTLTLLLCLTEEEQLFAVRIQEDPAPTTVETPVPEAASEMDAALPIMGA